MILARIQKFCLPVTLLRASRPGRVKTTLPLCESAFVLSANGCPFTVADTGPVLPEVPSSTQDPFQTSHRSLRSSDGAAGGGVCVRELGSVVTWTTNVTVAPAF